MRKSLLNWTLTAMGQALCVVLYLTVLLLLARPVDAEPLCIDRPLLVATMEKDYGELLLWYGLTADTSSVLEVFMNTETGTWTALITRANGTTCVLTTGNHSKVNWSPS